MQMRHAYGLALWFGLISLALAQDRAPAPPPDVAAPPANAIHAANGVAMIVLKSGSGTDHPTGDDCVVVRFTAWRRDGSLFSTSGVQGQTSTQCLTAAIPGIVEALTTMVPGEQRRVWVPSELTFGTHMAHHSIKTMHEEAPPRLDLTFDVELVSILKAAEKPLNLKTPPAGASKTPAGVAILVLRPGVGAKHPNSASRVTLNYTGWTADGKLFETTATSGHPASFLMGTTLAGWREALPYMVIGEKARIWIPAALAYGERPVDKMVPAGDLVYDIELLDFR